MKCKCILRCGILFPESFSEGGSREQFSMYGIFYILLCVTIQMNVSEKYFHLLLHCTSKIHFGTISVWTVSRIRERERLFANLDLLRIVEHEPLRRRATRRYIQTYF